MGFMFDVHIAHIPSTDLTWWEECQQSLAGQPVVVHTIPGIVGDLRRTRFNGYNCGFHDYVAHVDPDDRVRPGAFAAITHVLKQNPGCAGVYTVSNRISESGRILGELHPYRPWTPNYLSTSITTVHQLSVMRRDIITQVMRDNWEQIPKMGYTELVYYAMLALRHDWIALDFVGYDWRIHPKCSHKQIDNVTRQASIAQLKDLAAKLLLRSF